MMFCFIFFCCLLLFCFFIKLFRKADSEFNEQRERFVCYLENINDLETLKRIGEINMFGVRERWYPRYTNLIPYIEDKIEQTDDDNFKIYLDSYERFIKDFLCTMPFIILSMLIPIIYIISIFKN